MSVGEACHSAAAMPPTGPQQVADLLRSSRARLQPRDVGLAPGGRRRTQGLRREQVAQLAGISTTYYTFLEQGRDVRPSRQVIDALARALRLDAAERIHLHELVHGMPPATTRGADEHVAPAVADLVHRLDPHPTYVTGRSWDVLALARFRTAAARHPHDPEFVSLILRLQSGSPEVRA